MFRYYCRAALDTTKAPAPGLGVVGAVGLGPAFLGTGTVADPDPAALYTAESLGVLLVFAAAIAFALGTGARNGQ